MRKYTVFSEVIDGVECELTFEPCECLMTFKAASPENVLYGYITHDTDVRDMNDMLGDGMGALCSFHRWAGDQQHRDGLKALGLNRDGEPDLDSIIEDHETVVIARYLDAIDNWADVIEELHDGEEDVVNEASARAHLTADVKANDWQNVIYEETMLKVLLQMWDEPEFFPGDKYAVVLDCYDHGSQHWSISGRGYQCRWDTARGAGVWVPDQYLREQIDLDVAKGLDLRAQSLKYCQQFLDSYNDVINGNVYGVVVECFDREGNIVRDESCWGYIGSEHAEESLKEVFEYQQSQLMNGARA